MIVAVTGGKGGVGKSTVALNLGSELDGVVVDLDVTTPDLPRGVGPTLHDVLAGQATPSAAVDERGPVALLPCGRTLAGARAADLGALAAVADRLERTHGRVVLDCPAGLSRLVGTAVAQADRAVVVTTPDESAVVDALRTRDVVRTLETPIDAGVLNRTTVDSDGAVATRLDRALGAPITTIADRPAIAAAFRRGRPVAEVEPSNPALESFAAIGQALENEV